MSAEKTEKQKELVRSIKFVLFSISAGIIQIGSFTLMEEVLHLTHWVAYLISLILSVVWNFTLNRKYTFQSANNVPIAMLKVLGYYVVFTPLSIFGGVALVNIGWDEYLVLAISMVVNFVTEYLFDTFVVFRNSIDTNDIAKKQAQQQGKTDGQSNDATDGKTDE